MKLMGFNFRKIFIERKSDSLENIKIDTKINIANVEKLENNLFKGTDKELFKIDFVYIIDYSSEIAKIELSGNLLIAVEKDLSAKILEKWENKKLPEEIKITVFNIILKKSNIRALELEEQMNLPTHIPLPLLKKQEDKE
jgi:hypothetical protein